MVTCQRKCTPHISREAGSDGAMTDYIACMQVQGVWTGRGAVGSHTLQCQWCVALHTRVES